MKPLRICAFVVLLACCASAQEMVFVVRHSEKVAENMNDKATPLSDAGRARSQHLADLLRDSGITAAYATDTVRAHDTAQPLASARNLEIKTYESKDYAALAATVRKQDKGGRVLIVGHSNTLDGILRAFGYAAKEPIAGDYGIAYVLIPRDQQTPLLMRIRF